MELFDYERYRVVGLVEDKLGDNATIDVIGYCDDSFYTFTSLTRSEILDLFPSRGKVFAYRFSIYHENLKGRIVCLCVQPSNNDGSESYVWDWDGDVLEYGKRISTLKGIFSNDGQHNYDILRNNNLLDLTEDEFVYSEDKVYLICSTNREQIIKYWNVSSLNMVTIDGTKYIVGISLPKYDGLIDIANDEQLVNWYLSKVVKKDWANITQNKSFRSSECFLMDLLTSMSHLDESILRCRFNRLRAINTNLTLTFDNLKEIAETPWFKEVVMKSISEERQHLLEQIKNENDSELEKISDTYKSELLRLKEEQNRKINILKEEAKDVLQELSEQKNTLVKELQKKNIEIESLNELETQKKQIIATLENSIDNLNDRKDSIIRDFSIIREVLNVTNQTDSKRIEKESNRFSLEEITFSEKPISRFQAYVKSIENILKANDVHEKSPLTMGRMLVRYNVLLCPSILIAQTFIFASHKCKYMTEYVGVKWTSYEDLWRNGLGYIVSKCMEDTSIMYFLVLQNINLSYLPNFMQPLVDLQEGIITKLPNSNIAFPKNLRILCTISEDELIKMPASTLKSFGCIDKLFNFDLSGKMKFADDANLGYLTPEELCSERDEDFEVENMFEQYIDE